MTRTHRMSINALDALRLRHGARQMEEQFHALALRDEDAALAQLNDSNLQYPTLYLLEPEIVKMGLGGRLSDRNRLARLFAAALTEGPSSLANGDRPELQPVLRWMQGTGWQAEPMEEQYERILDRAAILLTHRYHDDASLPAITEHLFARHRHGRYAYDLQWALFAGAPDTCLQLLQNKLRSADGRDVELARKLLNVAPSFSTAGNPERQRRLAGQWLTRNRAFLRPTGATSQEGPDIHRWELAHDQKYLHHRMQGGEVERILSPWEMARLQAFAACGEGERQLLSECSQRLRRHNLARWQCWMNKPIDQQLRTARRLLG